MPKFDDQLRAHIETIESATNAICRFSAAWLTLPTDVRDRVWEDSVHEDFGLTPTQRS